MSVTVALVMGDGRRLHSLAPLFVRHGDDGDLTAREARFD